MPSRNTSREDESNRPPVAIVVLDTLRADMLSRPDLLDNLPSMRQIFDESYVFTRAYAPSNWTLPSHASIFTGLSPREHMARAPYMMLREDVPTIAELAQREGYHTACVSCNRFLSQPFGMLRGFKSYWKSNPNRTERAVTRVKHHASSLSHQHEGVLRSVLWTTELAADLVMTSGRFDNGAKYASQRIHQVLNEASDPTFLVVNLMEAHEPYYGRGTFSGWRARAKHVDVFRYFANLAFAVMAGRIEMNERDWRNIETIYWENVKYLDYRLGLIIRRLQTELLDEQFLIVASDHGQLFGEKGALGHEVGLDEGLIRVPLAIRPPGGIRGARIDHPVDITWLFHLLRDIISGREGALNSWLAWTKSQDIVFSEAQGALAPYVTPRWGRKPLPATDILAFRIKQDHPAIACISRRRKLVCHLGRKEDELYDLASDPREVVNIVSKEAGIHRELHERLRERFLRGDRNLPSDVRKDRLSIEAKQAITKIVLRDALSAKRKPVQVWTGGKDSNLVLYLCLAVARQYDLETPPLLFVDHGQHFQETWSFMEDIAQREGLEILVARNEELVAEVVNGSEKVSFDALDSVNQKEALRAGLDGTEVTLSLDTLVGNHLLKTVALKKAVRQYEFDALITGIRWDENPVRSGEVFFSSREAPPHIRVHPILHWTESEVWTHTLDSGLPIHPLYVQGYRSFDGVRDSRPTGTRPAWEQDLEASAERAGRSQDKEEIMERLRALGYF